MDFQIQLMSWPLLFPCIDRIWSRWKLAFYVFPAFHFGLVQSEFPLICEVLITFIKFPGMFRCLLMLLSRHIGNSSIVLHLLTQPLGVGFEASVILLVQGHA